VIKRFCLFLVLALMVSACAAKESTPSAQSGMGVGDSGMMARHHAKLPANYAGKTNPVAADEVSVERGKKVYTVNCALCHGEGGMGDGPFSEGITPAPAPVAHTSQMMSDDYLYWRISEGGAAFNSSMPSWGTLDERSRWDVINYMRALGAGTVQPGEGGAAFDPAVQATQQAETLAQAVDKKIITRAEAETFTLVHGAMETYRSEHPEIMNSGKDATEREAAISAELVKAQTITQAQADAFGDIHDRLGKAGLMP
jgi:mono/diheme cytochrome c family protein